MNMKRLFFTGAIALGLVACSESNDPIEQIEKGNTYASVSVTLEPTTRALSDTMYNNAGTTAEQALEALDVLSSAGNKAFSLGAENTDGKFWQVGTSTPPVYTTAPWLTTAGAQTLALLFNKNAITAGSAAAAATEEYSGALSGLTTPNLTMTSKGFTATILPNKSKEDVAGGSGLTDNVINGIEVERVVAKGIVRKGTGFVNEVKQDSVVVGTVSDITFAAVNGAKKTYLYRNNAGERTLTVADDNQYTGFKSAIHTLAPIQNDTLADEAGLVRLGLIGDTNVSTALDVNEAGAKPEDTTTKVFYFMENSGDINGTDMKALGFYRFAYAKVYAVYTPKSVLQTTGNANLVPGTTGKWYIKNTDGTFSESTAGTAGAVEGTLVWALESTPIAAGTTFYKGAVDGVLYASKAAAKSSITAPNQASYTYKNGKCGYRALWNRQTKDTNSDEVVNASARRNNAYVLNIKAFTKLGFPWDESDPNDPNLPKDEDDEDEDLPDPTDPNIETSETYMRVEAVVLPWNVVDRDIIL